MPFTNSQFPFKEFPAPIVHNLYCDTEDQGEPIPPPTDFYLLDNSGENLLDNSSEPFITNEYP